MASGADGPPALRAGQPDLESGPAPRAVGRRAHRPSVSLDHRGDDRQAEPAAGPGLDVAGIGTEEPVEEVPGEGRVESDTLILDSQADLP